MSVAELEPPTRQELSRFRVQDKAIAKLAEDYLPLKIDGINDKKGFDLVHRARMDVKNRRVDVEKLRKELKADALEYGRQVDSEARRITEMLEPIESHLQAEEDAVTAEKARIKKAEEDARAKIVEERVQALMAFGVDFKRDWLAGMTEEAFQAELKNARCQYEIRQAQLAAEKERIAAADKAREELAATLAAERAALDAQRKAQDAEAARLKAHAAAIEAKAAFERRHIELENAKREASEKSRVETEQRIADEQAIAKARAELKAENDKLAAEAKEAARLKAEAMRPQVEKLLSVAAQVLFIVVPDGPGADAVKAELARCEVAIRKIAGGLQGAAA